jgi:hypothetical protein
MSMSSKFGRGLALFGRGVTALGVVAAVASTAHADRRTGMAGNLLIEDKDDVYFFPQLTSTYRNLVSLDYGPTDDTGNALLTLGDQDFAFGVALHRSDALTPWFVGRNTELGGLIPDAPLSIFQPPNTTAASITQSPATIIDLLFATGALGFRVALGRSYTGSSDAMSTSNTAIMGEVGWGTGTRGTDTRIDLSGSVLLNFAGTTDAMGDDASSGTGIGVNGLIRAYSPMDATMDLGFLGRLGVNSVSVASAVAPEPADSLLNFYLGGGVGPAFRFGDAQVAAYGVINFDYRSNDPNSEVDMDEVSRLGVIIPGINIAAEIPLNDWFQVRTGAQYNWELADFSAEPAGSGNQDGTFGWNAGLGVVLDQFRFDGALQSGFVTSGPNFIGGGTGFLAIASLTYSFDKLRSGEVVETTTTTTETETTLEPAPTEPVLQPAPPPAAPMPENPEGGATSTTTTTTTTTPTSASGSAGGSISIGN